MKLEPDVQAADAYRVRADDVGLFEGMPILIKRSTFVIDERGGIKAALYGVASKGHADALRAELIENANRGDV